jgi:hypothetical protein
LCDGSIISQHCKFYREGKAYTHITFKLFKAYLYLIYTYHLLYHGLHPSVVVELLTILLREVLTNIYLTTRQYIPEESKLHSRRRENLKSHNPSYSGGPRLKSRPGDRLRFLVVFLSPSRKFRNRALKKATTASFHILTTFSFTYYIFIRH